MLLALVACGNDSGEVDGPVAEARAIGFQAQVSTSASATRAATGQGELTTELLKACGFGVYCWYTGTTRFDNFTGDKTHISQYMGKGTYQLMRNQKVAWDATSALWTYTPQKYWPLEQDELLTLRAYAPYTSYLKDDSHGLPLLPVVVKYDDFCHDSQHDPLWGTSKHDVVPNRGENERFGMHYDNYTYVNSGEELTADSRDGTIDWFFHHGMAKLKLNARLAVVTPGTDVWITEIEGSPYYEEGLLNIFTSPATSSADKPNWDDRHGDMTVTLGYHHRNDHDDLNRVVLTAVYQEVAVKGLLVIPRDYTTTPLHVSITYATQTGDGAPVYNTTSADLYIDITGNTVYEIQMMLNAESNTLYLSSFVNLDWQTGSYKKVEV